MVLRVDKVEKQAAGRDAFGSKTSQEFHNRNISLAHVLAPDMRSAAASWKHEILHDTEI